MKKQIFMSTITITFGNIPSPEFDSFNSNDLKSAFVHFQDLGCECEMIDLSEGVTRKEGEEKAFILVARNAVQNIMFHVNELNEIEGKELDHSTLPDIDNLYSEQINLDHNRIKLVDKNCYNLCFAEDVTDSKLIPWSAVPLTDSIKRSLPGIVGRKAGLIAEGDYYWNNSRCGIGYRGENKKCILAMRLGSPLSLNFRWYQTDRCANLKRLTDDRISIPLYNGDMYMLNEKASGFDWLNPDTVTLLHASGCGKYIK